MKYRYQFCTFTADKHAFVLASLRKNLAEHVGVTCRRPDIQTHLSGHSLTTCKRPNFPDTVK